MKLSDKQRIFAQNVARLLAWIYHHPRWGVTFAEAYRPPDVGELYAKQGRGIKDSLHCKRLAIDLNLFIGEKYQTSTKAHKPIGLYWESLHPLNRWGGNFKRKDGNHYEMRLW